MKRTHCSFSSRLPCRYMHADIVARNARCVLKDDLREDVDDYLNYVVPKHGDTRTSCKLDKQEEQEDDYLSQLNKISESRPRLLIPERRDLVELHPQLQAMDPLLGAKYLYTTRRSLDEVKAQQETRRLDLGSDSGSSRSDCSSDEDEDQDEGVFAGESGAEDHDVGGERLTNMGTEVELDYGQVVKIYQHLYTGQKFYCVHWKLSGIHELHLQSRILLLLQPLDETGTIEKEHLGKATARHDEQARAERRARKIGLHRLKIKRDVEVRKFARRFRENRAAVLDKVRNLSNIGSAVHAGDGADDGEPSSDGLSPKLAVDNEEEQEGGQEQDPGATSLDDDLKIRSIPTGEADTSGLSRDQKVEGLRRESHDDKEDGVEESGLILDDPALCDEVEEEEVVDQKMDEGMNSPAQVQEGASSSVAGEKAKKKRKRDSPKRQAAKKKAANEYVDWDG